MVKGEIMSDLTAAVPWGILVRLFLAVFLGGLIGLEREFHGRPAGLRTHILVCLGATMIMMIPELLSPRWPRLSTTANVWMDPGRIAAGIVTGIGFLGAGTILRIGDIVRGLTTAACIWFTAALGVMIGSGHLVLAGISAAIGLLILLVFEKLEDWISPTVYRIIRVGVRSEHIEGAEDRMKEILRKFQIQVQDRSYWLQKDNEEMEMTFQVRTKRDVENREVVMELGNMEGVIRVLWDRL